MPCRLAKSEAKDEAKDEAEDKGTIYFTDSGK